MLEDRLAVERQMSDARIQLDQVEARLRELEDERGRGMRCHRCDVRESVRFTGFARSW